MASSISPVATIWLSAPSSSHGQNAAVGHGKWSPVAAITTAKKMSENGKPNRKRILVAPQVPSGPVSDRCIALRATCPSAAVIVKGIQSVAMENIWGIRLGGRNGKHRAGQGRCGQSGRRHDRIAACSLAPLAGRGRRRPTAAVLYRRTPKRSIGYGEGDSRQVRTRG